MTGFVYRWVNKINNKWYIGSHKGTTDDGYRHSSKVLRAAENKYGVENFTRKILFEGDYKKDQIKNKEATLLQQHNAANNPMSYNMTNIVGANCVSEQTKQKISVANKGRKLKTRSAKTRRNMSLAQLGKRKGKTYEEIYGPELAAKLRKTRSKSKIGNTNGRRQPVQINDIIYPSIREAASVLKKDTTTIWKWLKTGQHRAKRC